MAISDDIPGMKVSIVGGGHALIEYEDTEVAEEECTTTRYIQATSDQQFEIHIKVAKGTKIKGDCLVCIVDVDGNSVEGTIIEAIDFKNRYEKCILKGCEIGGGMIRKFRFASLETASDGQAFKGEATTLKKLGSIVIEVSQQKLKCKSREAPNEPHIEDIGFISEKALKGKALSHSVKLANPEKNRDEEKVYWDTVPVKGVPNPVATFIFHYRSKAALQAMLIIPRTPSPPPFEERDIASMSQAELVEMQKELKAIKEARAAAVKIKREHGDENPRPRKVSRPKAGDTLFEIGDDDNVREGSTSTLAAAEREVIELD